MTLIKTLTLLIITLEALELENMLICETDEIKKFYLNFEKISYDNLMKKLKEIDKSNITNRILSYKKLLKINKLNWEMAEDYFSFLHYLEKFAFIAKKNQCKQENLYAIKGLLLLEKICKEISENEFKIVEDI
jgi:hypothetical protein